jgi:hypothetical protein
MGDGLGTRHEWPCRQLTIETQSSRGLHRVSCAVNNRSPDNFSARFSPRAHYSSRGASFEADAQPSAASPAPIQGEPAKGFGPHQTAGR